MKFKQELPKRSGVYWYVDIDYPIPQIAYVDVKFGGGVDFYELCGGRTTLTIGHIKHLRWGDEIVAPDTRTNEVE